MASSPSSQQRAQLIREMSKDTNRTRHSSGSSRNSQGARSPEPTTSDFDPENEAIMSTRQLESHSQQLPLLRTTVQKPSRFTQPAEPDYAINTSAIGRAFPDFSQGGTSSEDDSMSIEIGRGAKRSGAGTIGKLGRSRDYSSNAHLSIDDGDSMDFSPAMVGDYEVTATPPLKHRQAPRKHEDSARGSLRHEHRVRKPSGLQNELLDPSPPPAKTKDYGSGESRQGSGETRRSLAAMHARVRDENDLSHLDDERPPTVNLTARNTRFGNTKHSQPSVEAGALPTRFSSAQTLLGSVAPAHKQKLQKLATPNQGTQQSFMLPDLPNISELVSGVFEDGTPVFSRHSKPRSSRFVSQNSKAENQRFAGVEEIPVPEDEQAIFLSLKLLQDKVATLEKNNAEAVTTIAELQQKNRTLETEKYDHRRVPRSDSALGMTDSDGGNGPGGGQRKFLIEKNRLETSAKILEQQLDAAQRRSSTAEMVLKQITQERDSAVSQLGVAFVTIEQLKVENEDLRKENNRLKARSGRSHKHQDMQAEAISAQSQEARGEGAVEDKSKENAIASRASQKAQVPSSHTQSRRDPKRRTQNGSPVKDADNMFDLSSRQDTKKFYGNNQETYSQEETSEDNEESIYECSRRIGKGKSPAKESYPSKNAQDQETGAAQDLTYLSFLDNREIAQLRQTLERERIERKQRRTLGRQNVRVDPTVTQSGYIQPEVQSSQKAAPRKSSMKDLTGRPTKERYITETSQLANQQHGHDRRHSEPSMLSVRGRRRDINAENITSAFIVPDITIKNVGANTTQVPKLSKEGQEIIDNLAAHDLQNCTVCKREVKGDEKHEHDETTKRTVNITTPTPVSDRVPEADEEFGNATIRPAQPPGLALATVLKELEDELDHLKIQLSHYQTLYNSHDPALSKRKRKSVQQKMETILQTIDIKADQIYALYDVLEGQKQDGHEISDEEVEITLQSIGVVKAPELRLRGGGDDDEKGNDGDEKAHDERHPWDLESDAGDSEDLPWEGIESTVETTKSGFARAARRKNGGS